uniref:Glycosyltransferase n=1 Tax=Polygala tenuifolia TaxID=355332 RepID=A0A3G3NCU6_9FABA|nr:UDP-glucosyltransferase UGT86J1 [Polygala tenuifolia]
MEKNQPRLHAIMFPLPFQGHVNPLMQLAIKLASMGVTVTFVNTQFIDQQINKARAYDYTAGDDMFAEARQSGLDIRYTTITDGFPLKFDRNAIDKFWPGLEIVFPAHVDELLSNMMGSDLDPTLTCLIADTFFNWTSDLARKHNLVNVSCWTQPALTYSINYHMDLLKMNGHFGSHDIREDAITYIPGVPAIDLEDLPSFFQQNDPSDLIVRIAETSFQCCRRADFVLFNTIEELESETISALQHDQQQIYAVGPLVSSLELAKGMVPSASFHFESDCAQWLNTKPHGSVLYVSFGSACLIGKLDIMELAYALFLSEVNFVWVLPPHLVGSDPISFLPAGYEEDIKDKGLIVQWCNQVAVLSHSATGGFLSHCGWNSTLESIWCGIPLLCSPLSYDQTPNRKLIVDAWKIGLNLCQKKSIRREEAARNIQKLMHGEIADELRSNVSVMRQTMKHATVAGGSTERNLDRFINSVKAKSNMKFDNDRKI